MTPQIAIVLTILGVAVVLFVTEWIRVDVVALMVLVGLALTGLVTPAEALSGFANLAVVTVWAVLILSSGPARTGVAALIGCPVLRVARGSEARLIALIMLVVGVLSGFVNDIGVSPYPLMMAIAVSASVAFLSPVGHSANVLVMGPGGYRFMDDTTVGTPLALVALLVLPIFWPF